MYGLRDINRVSFATRIPTSDNEVAEATEYVKRLRNMDESGDQFDEGDINAIADLLVSAYGIQED